MDLQSVLMGLLKNNDPNKVRKVLDNLSGGAEGSSRNSRVDDDHDDDDRREGTEISTLVLSNPIVIALACFYYIQEITGQWFKTKKNIRVNWGRFPEWKAVSHFFR